MPPETTTLRRARRLLLAAPLVGIAALGLLWARLPAGAPAQLHPRGVARTAAAMQAGGAAGPTDEGGALPTGIELSLPAEVCAAGAPVSATLTEMVRLGPAASVRAPRRALALDSGCAAALPLDPGALAAGGLRMIEVCAWGGPRPRCAVALVAGWTPGAPPPEGLEVVGDRWRWAVELPPAEPSPGSGCFAGTAGEIGGHELSLAQFSLAGRYLTVDLARPAAGRGAACALARAGAALETPAVGVGSTELASVLVQ